MSILMNLIVILHLIHLFFFFFFFQSMANSAYYWILTVVATVAKPYPVSRADLPNRIKTVGIICFCCILMVCNTAFVHLPISQTQNVAW